MLAYTAVITYLVRHALAKQSQTVLVDHIVVSKINQDCTSNLSKFSQTKANKNHIKKLGTKMFQKLVIYVRLSTQSRLVASNNKIKGHPLSQKTSNIRRGTHNFFS